MHTGGQHSSIPSYSMVPAMATPSTTTTGTPRNQQVATPPHASQVPPQADSLLMLLQRYPVMWQGLLALKTDQAAVQMHFVHGNRQVGGLSLPCNSDGSTPPLRIAQRMRLEQTQLEGVARKMQVRISRIHFGHFSSLLTVFFCFADRKRALHVAGTAMRSRSHGRVAAVHQPAERIHHLFATETSGRHCQHSGTG